MKINARGTGCQPLYAPESMHLNSIILMSKLLILACFLSSMDFETASDSHSSIDIFSGNQKSLQNTWFVSVIAERQIDPNKINNFILELIFFYLTCTVYSICVGHEENGSK